MNDVVISKIQSIQRCIKRAREEYHASDDFKTDYTRQDAAVLNVTRACEQALDLANHIIKKEQIGIPQDSSGSFKLISDSGIISHELSRALIKMVGFRNTAVHEYQELNIDIVIVIITKHLDEILDFTEAMKKYAEL